MICETCGKENNGKFATGRFCTKKCACSFSTKTKRLEINKKVSETLKKEKLLRICETCGIEFFVHKSKKDSRFCSKLCINHKISEKTKDLLSKKRIEYLSKNKNVKWYDVKNINNQNIKIQGKWELDFANRCNELKILFLRHVIKFNNVHYYTPDFYIPKYNIYIEIKGFLYEKDKYKMLKVIEEHKIILKMIMNHSFIEIFKEDELLLLKNVDEMYKLNEINYDSFVKRY